MHNLAEHLTTTKQSERASANQVPNNCGAYVFPVDEFAQLRRFLILGSSGGTYYTSERTLTRNNAAIVLQCLLKDPKRTFDLIGDVSEQALAPKNTPAVFAVALAATVSDANIGEMRRACFLRVVRTSTHLFEFLTYVKSLRGWGNSLKKLVQAWYTTRTREQLATQFVKYRSRNGWTHKDALTLSHVKADAPNNDLRRWVVRDEAVTADVPRIIEGYLRMRDVSDGGAAAALIEEYRLPHEAVPTELQADDRVFSTLVAHMPLFATVRQLARMVTRGVLNDKALLKLVCDRLVDERAITAGKLHPANYLLAGIALRRLGSGHAPRALLESVEDGTLKAFRNVQPSNKNLLLGVDVSGSMQDLCGSLPISAAEAAAVMTYVTVRAEPNAEVMAFSNVFSRLSITAKDSFESVLQKTSGLPFSGTDCSLPIEYATKNKLSVDGFIILTDNETNTYGRPQPADLLRKYNMTREKPAKFIVQAFTATNFSIADASDANMLDVVGLDASTPLLISNFMSDIF